MINIFKGKNIFLVILCILVHQALVASSIVFLTKLLINFQEHIYYKNYLFLYLGSMILPHTLGFISYIFLEKSINLVHYRYFILVKNSESIKKYKF